jgi:hypothetical protein
MSNLLCAIKVDYIIVSEFFLTKILGFSQRRNGA